MATDLERVLRKSGYTALPLPRGKTGPTAIYGIQHGQVYIVRNPQTCIRLDVTPESGGDIVQYSREFSFDLNGIANFILHTLGIGKAKAELDARSIKSATVLMGGLTHETIQTGSLIDEMLAFSPGSPCERDIYDPDHLTVVAALKAASFTYTFRSEKGVTVKLSAEEANGLFQADASTGVSVTESGQIVVNAPAYVGYVTWSGSTIRSEVESAQRYADSRVKALAAPGKVRPYEAPSILGGALKPDEITAMRLKSLGVKMPAAAKLRAKPKAKTPGAKRASRPGTRGPKRPSAPRRAPKPKPGERKPAGK